MIKISNKCTICSKKGHLNTYCPNKIKLMEQRKLITLENKNQKKTKRKRKKKRSVSSICDSSSESEPEIPTLHQQVYVDSSDNE